MSRRRKVLWTIGVVEVQCVTVPARSIPIGSVELELLYVIQALRLLICPVAYPRLGELLYNSLHVSQIAVLRSRG